MARRDPSITLRQIIECIDQARELVDGKERGDLDCDTTFRLASERAVEVIGEAMTRLPDPVREAHPEVPWHRVIGMRNWLAHGYDMVDLDVLWDVIARRLDELEAMIRPILDSFKPSDS